MAIEAHVPRGERNPLPHDLELSGEARNVLIVAEAEADRVGHRDIRSEHRLLGLVESGNGFAAELLRKKGLSADQLRSQLKLLSS